MFCQYYFNITTPGRGMIDITAAAKDYVKSANCAVGLCHIFLHHTSASLVLCENADPQVQKDAEDFMQRLVPDGDSLFKHIAEGPDDMPSHIRSMLTCNFLTIPITDQRLALGTWQGIYLWEHRKAPHHRKITFSIWGNS